MQDAHHLHEFAPDAVGHDVRRPIDDELARPRAPTGTPTIEKLEKTGDRREDELDLPIGGGERGLSSSGTETLIGHG